MVDTDKELTMSKFEQQRLGVITICAIVVIGVLVLHLAGVL